MTLERVNNELINELNIFLVLYFYNGLEVVNVLLIHRKFMNCQKFYDNL